MATSKTGSFFLTETVQLPVDSASSTRVQGEIDLAAYVNVPTGQAVAIEEVDFIVQGGSDFASAGNLMLVADGAISFQVCDLNPGTAFVRADDQSLVASGSLNIDFTNNVLSHQTDLYPDSYGSLSEAFMVVNDTLYLVAGNDSAKTSLTDIIYVTCRIKCRVVKLSKSDWMAIAIQSTASDN